MSAKRGPYRKCYLVRHGAGFKYCRAVPKDLQPIEKKQAWVKYLGSVSRAEAETLAHALAHEHGKRILALRGHPAPAIQILDSAPGPHSIDVPAAPDAKFEPQVAPLATAPKQSVRDLLALWERVRAPRSQIGRAKAKRCVRRFVDLIGNLSIQEVKRADAVAYRDALEALPGMKPKNTAEHLCQMHTLFSVAMSEGMLDANPFHQVRARGSQKFASKRQGFTSEQVKAIFEGLRDESEAFAWIVRLLAFHGMRSGEACQLRTDDVTHLYGVPVLRVHDLYGSVKNQASVRDIPVHPACMKIFDLARDAALNSADGWLFPALQVKSLGRARWFQDYGSRFLRQKIGISDRRYTMHSFRHLWRTLARECEMPESISRSIMGHTLGGGEHGAYGAAPSLKIRAEWIAKIDPLK